MSAKRMRVFAGPNGSGKTTIFKGILGEEKIQLGVYVNADEIEQLLNKNKSLSFADFKLSITDNQIKDFFRVSQFAPVKRNEPDLWKKLHVVDNVFSADTFIDSYLAADVSEFIRQQLLQNDTSFTYETVMSHPTKIDFFEVARKRNFRVYLYYIATEDPEINNSRVNIRIAQQGHAVDPAIITSRYYKSLENLKAAVKQTNRAYIFDNSGIQANLIAEIVEGSDVKLNSAFAVPNWVAKYLLNK